MICGGLRTKGITKKSSAKKPLITVITVVFNGEKTIEKTINSIINQTYDNIEYILIDGASTDNTLDIIKKYEDKIDYWQSEPDKGIYDAMNKGIRLALGDYIALLNADDWYELNTCEIVSKKIQLNHQDVYYGVLNYYENEQLIKVEGYTVNLLPYGMIAHPTCFIKNDVYKSKLYDTNFKSASDYDLINWLVANNFRFCFCPDIIVNFSTGGMSSNKVGMMESLKIQLKYKHISFFYYLILFCYYKFFKKYRNKK